MVFAVGITQTELRSDRPSAETAGQAFEVEIAQLDRAFIAFDCLPLVLPGAGLFGAGALRTRLCFE